EKWFPRIGLLRDIAVADAAVYREAACRRPVHAQRRPNVRGGPRCHRAAAAGAASDDEHAGTAARRIGTADAAYRREARRPGPAAAVARSRAGAGAAGVVAGLVAAARRRALAASGADGLNALSRKRR